LVQIKDAPPYSAELEPKVLLNPLARAGPSKNSYAFTGKLPSVVPVNEANASTLKALFAQDVSGVGYVFHKFMGAVTDKIGLIPS
jgi:fatty acid synthase subunit alpha